MSANWLQQDELLRAELEIREFTRKTGIEVRPSPVPEALFSSLDALPQLDLLRKLLAEGDPSPDVLGIDVVWPQVLADDLIDLRPYLSAELSSLDPELVSGYTVNGKVVAVPYHTHVGVLAYRTDLLHEYGYIHPPETWDELERMADRIQKGERAKGRKDFWGYVWQGAPSEGLACNALEWQVDEGGGHIVEADQIVSVNNPAAIGAWQRAARWIGRISPPGVVAYRETDTLNVWNSGNAAFMRSWEWDDRLIHPLESPVRERTGYTSMPGGRVARVGALGGVGLAVARSSPHPREAVTFIRYLIAKEAGSKADPAHRQLLTEPQLYDVPQILQAHALSTQWSLQHDMLVSRPSKVTDHFYEDVSKAYIQAVYSVLTSQKKAPEAAAELERQLIQITGFHRGPPER